MGSDEVLIGTGTEQVLMENFSYQEYVPSNRHKNKTFMRSIMYITTAAVIAMALEKWWHSESQMIEFYYGEDFYAGDEDEQEQLL